MLDSGPADGEATAAAPIASHRRVLVSAALLGITTALVKLAALGKDWFVARQFGANDDLDAFFVAFLIPSYAVVVLAHSFAPAFLPTYIRVGTHQGPAAARRLVATALGRGGCVLLITIVALAAAAPHLIPWAGQGFDPSKVARAVTLFYPLLGVLLASGFTAIFAGVLTAHERFAITAMAPLALPLATLAILWTSVGEWGVEALALGTVVGFACESVILAIAAHRQRLLAWPCWDDAQRHFSHVTHQYGSAALGAALMSSSMLVDQTMAASLGSGSVSIWNYGTKCLALAMNVVAASLSTVMFPRFARLITTSRWPELAHTIRWYTLGIAALSVPGIAVLTWGAEPMVRLLFERGAFTAETTRAVAGVQFYLAWQLPFAILSMLGGRLLSALDGNRLALGIGLINLVANVVGNVILMRWFGVNGIAMSTSLMYVVAALATLLAIRWRLAAVRAGQFPPEPADVLLPMPPDDGATS